MTRLTTLAVCLGLAVAASGCGNAATTTVTPEPSAPAVEDPAPRDATDNVPGYSVSEQDTYDMANVACSAFPPSKIARDFGMHTTDPDALASRYARGYAAPLKRAAYEGCLDGIIGR
jgi:hypothetical protein